MGVLSFALQMLFGRIALDKLGLAVTTALLPAVVVLGGAFGLAVPGLWSTAILRGAEASQRNSLFRAAYELLYTPLSEEKKRSTKTLIDVGFDRLGTVAASGIVAAALYLAHARADGVLLGIAVGCAIVTLLRSRALHTGYVTVLEESLRKEAEKLSPPSEPGARPTLERVEMHDQIVEHLNDLPRTEAMAAIATGQADSAPPAIPATDSTAETTAQARESLDLLVKLVGDLRSGNSTRVQKVLAAPEPLAAPLVAFAILLLADKDFHRDGIRALRKSAGKTTGQLCDALCDPGVEFDIRRRIPRVLGDCPTQVAVDGLVRGTEDERFEVRYECGRALLKITGANPAIVIPLEVVIAMVQREVSVSKEIWESQPPAEFDDEEDQPPALVDRLLRDRIDRSLEHVFTLLALNLDRESFRIAFKALHEDDPRLRGTALEYLETVLPDAIRDAVWPFLGEDRPLRAARPAKEILADLVAARKAEPAIAIAAAAPAPADVSSSVVRPGEPRPR